MHLTPGIHASAKGSSPKINGLDLLAPFHLLTSAPGISPEVGPNEFSFYDSVDHDRKQQSSGNPQPRAPGRLAQRPRPRRARGADRHPAHRGRPLEPHLPPDHLRTGTGTGTRTRTGTGTGPGTGTGKRERHAAA